MITVILSRCLYCYCYSAAITYSSAIPCLRRLSCVPLLQSFFCYVSSAMPLLPCLFCHASSASASSAMPLLPCPSFNTRFDVIIIVTGILPLCYRYFCYYSYRTAITMLPLLLLSNASPVILKSTLSLLTLSALLDLARYASAAPCVCGFPLGHPSITLSRPVSFSYLLLLSLTTNPDYSDMIKLNLTRPF